MATFMSLFAEYLTLRDEISRFMSTRFNSGAGRSKISPRASKISRGVYQSNRFFSPRPPRRVLPCPAILRSEKYSEASACMAAFPRADIDADVTPPLNGALAFSMAMIPIRCRWCC